MNKENKKKHYLIYQTTNLVNNKIYIGKHITENIEDQYFGSGKYLQNAIKKYGLKNFEFKILIDLNNEEEMNLLEKCVVTQEFCDRKDTYNINVGGDGGWSYVNQNTIENFKKRSKCQKNRFKRKDEREKMSILCKNVYNNYTKDEKEKILKRLQDGHKKALLKNPDLNRGKNNGMFGKKVPQKQRNYMSNLMKTDRNYMKNSIWYVNYETEENIILKKDDKIPDGFVKGKCQDFKKHKEKVLNKIKKQEEKQKQLEILKQQLTLMAKIYEQYGIEKVQQEYPNFVGTSSASAFCHMLKRYKIQYKKYQKRKNK